MSITEAEQLRALPSEQARLDYIIENIEESYFADHKEYLAETDTAWDAIHRALTDGELTWDGGEYPLNHVVLAGELLYTDPDYILSLKSPEQVREIAAALSGVSESEFRRRYFAIDSDRYGCTVDELDFAYTWGWFQNLCRLYSKAATEGRFVLFTADQ
ncbi:YfbM family protein [Singulisphaera sp. Ch08]|uniref:YfbM family protein n=1 Tax=Singulisphaera sp. Ch08 TaxID=3120278 RepID=A0AAU7CE11_9BACT